jgi:hypothetical protein
VFPNSAIALPAAKRSPAKGKTAGGLFGLSAAKNPGAGTPAQRRSAVSSDPELLDGQSDHEKRRRSGFSFIIQIPFVSFDRFFGAGSLTLSSQSLRGRTGMEAQVPYTIPVQR